MTRLMRWPVVVGLFVASIDGAAVSFAGAAEPDQQEAANKKRQELWQALSKALPKKYEQIEAYAENSSLTMVLFRSQGATLRFTLQTGKVEEVLHMKALGRINRITFEQRGDDGDWVLWLNGQRELTIVGEK